MAKSKSFFGLRTGSTKSHTYSVMNGEQVTKDRVTYVSNPQTDAQLYQRLKLPIVACSKAVLKGLVNHSYEGVSYGKQSLKAFDSRNLEQNALTVQEYVPKGVTDTGTANLIVSDGTLDVNICTIKTQNKMTVYVPSQLDEFSFTTVDAAKGAAVPDALMKQITQLLALDANKQLTMLMSYQSSDYSFYIDADNTATGHYHRFIISRLIGDLTKTRQWQMGAALKAQSEDEQEIVITDNYLTLTFAQTIAPESPENDDIYYVTFDVTTATSAKICSGTCISSEYANGAWKRSPQRLTVYEGDTAQTFENVRYSYLNAKNTSTSAKYLNTGLDGTGIEGGTQ